MNESSPTETVGDLQSRPGFRIMEAKEWITMFCPNCGNECMDENICPHCGQELHTFKDNITNDKLDALVGRYEGIDGYIDLSYFTITIHKVLLSKHFEHTIPFHDLADVAFQPASATVDGYLSFREHTDSTTRVETDWDAGLDEKSIMFNAEKK